LPILWCNSLKKQEVLEVNDLSVSAYNRPILKNITFTLNLGEALLITGRSGCGKTTLLRALTGIAKELYNLNVVGKIKIYGEKIHSSIEASKYIHYVVQEPWFSISAPYPISELFIYSCKNQQYIEYLAKTFSIYHKLWESSTNLSAGEAERIALIEAFASDKKIVLIDEATSYLDKKSKELIADTVKKLKEYGLSLIIVDHNVELWSRIADNILYIEDGYAKIFDDVYETPIYHQLLSLRKKYRELKINKNSEDKDTILEVYDLWYKYPDSNDYIIKSFNINAASGEVIWIKGSSGSGKTTLLKLLAGVLKPSRGYIKRPKNIQLIPENPLHYISNPIVIEELRNRIEIAKLVNLEGSLYTPIAFLSSGERRRLAIASAFMRQSKLLLVDEPTVGLDPWNALNILNIIHRLVKNGSTIVIASHSDEIGAIATNSYEV